MKSGAVKRSSEKTGDIPVRFSYKRFDPAPEEIASVDPRELRHMLFHLYLIREVEQRLLDLKDANQVHGPVHSSIGEEGTAVGVMQALDREDQITSTHRGHHHFLAKAYNAYAGGSYDPTEGVPAAIAEVTERAIAEIMGLSKGYCRGRGGSMHLGDRYSGCIGTNAIVAGGVPSAAGTAWAHRLAGNGHIAVAFMGDGALGQGVVYETMNMARLWRLPLIFLIENNLYAVATHVRDVFPVDHLAQRGLGFGIPSLVVDGMDPAATYLAAREARRIIRDEGGPVILEAESYRYKHQSQGLPGSAYGYRTKEEEGEWALRDPAVQYPTRLEKLGALTLGDDELLRKRAEEIVRRAIENLTQEAEGSANGGAAGYAGKRIVRKELWPSEEDLDVGVRSDRREFAHTRFVERSDFTDLPIRKFIDVIPEVILRRMNEDGKIIILGEEVAKMRGGVFMATKGIFRVHPDRVVNTPISEAGFTGLALGLAIMGFRPIVELMYPDFALVAADQIFNQIGKFRYMYGNTTDLPIVLRTKVGIGSGYGAQHSLEPAPLYALFPGWRILAPSDPFEYVGLFNAAMRALDPVLVIEHAMLYEESGEVPEDRDYFIDPLKARIARSGSQVTLVAYSYMTRKALAAAKKLEEVGVSAEVIDLRSVDYASVDYATIGRSIAKTGRVLICEEGLATGGIGAQLAYEIQRRFFDYLDHEICRVAARPVPIPVSKVQELRAIPQVENIVEAVRAMMPAVGR